MNLSGYSQKAASVILALKTPSELDIQKAVQSAIDEALVNPQKSEADALMALQATTDQMLAEQQNASEIIAGLQNEIATLRHVKTPVLTVGEMGDATISMQSPLKP